MPDALRDQDVVALYGCKRMHISSVTRFPNEHGVRRCFFCGEIAEQLDVYATEADLPRGL